MEENNQEDSLLEDYGTKVLAAVFEAVSTTGDKLKGNALSQSEKIKIVVEDLANTFDDLYETARESAKAADLNGLNGNEDYQEFFDKKAFEYKEAAEQLRSQLSTSLDDLTSAVNKVADSEVIKGIGELGGAAVDFLQIIGGVIELGTSGDGKELFANSVGALFGIAAGVLIVGTGGFAISAVGVALVIGWAVEDYAGKHYDEWMTKLGDLIAEWDPLGIMPDVNTDFTNALNWQPRRDPLVLDLDGDGIETTAADGSVLFDHDGDGVKNATGWIAPDDGILVLDRNGNGTIDNGQELFGDNTYKSNGEKAAHGFDALSDFDANKDGKIDSNDAVFSDLKIWKDLNTDGITQEGELFTLSEVGVKSISTESTQSNENVGNNNVASAKGSFEWESGKEGTAGSAANLDLAENNFYREFTDKLVIPEDMQALPDMQGSGAVRDLKEAATLSTDLKNVLETYSQAQTKDEQLAQIDNLLSHWASTNTTIPTLSQRIEGMSTDSLNFQFKWSWEVETGVGSSSGSSGDSSLSEGENNGPDAEDLAQKQLLERVQILEVFNGQTFFNFTPPDSDNGDQFVLGTGSQSIRRSVPLGETVITLTEDNLNLSAGQAEFINSAYEALMDSLYQSLLLQTRLKPLLDSVALEVVNGEVAFDYSSLNEKLRNLRITSNLLPFLNRVRSRTEIRGLNPLFV
ncbi:hypothetical protein [Endozoicomonas arenosclerae]|uniref:hypothetical protein n=1 Tax=Endozoicomonas arenosclerae TaxID=1633495 RepID=UPI000784C587|nr:hypothetical protein [Endozoicomonas arenosclerae]